jgi:hypothetical protein
MARFSNFLSWARVLVLLVPLFGLASAIQLGCDAKSANDVGALKPDGGNGGASPYDRYDGYGTYGDDPNYDGYDGYDGYDYGGYP